MEKAYLTLDDTARPFSTENLPIEPKECDPLMAQAVLLFNLKAMSELGKMLVTEIL